MTINKKTDENKIIIELSGRLDTTTAPELEEELEKTIGTAEELELDFKELEYISSAGLRVILRAHKEMSKRGGMVIRNVGEVIMEVFEITGFKDMLTIK
jgi:anti-sigma B factor antagonist